MHKYPYINFKNKYCLCKGHLRSPIYNSHFPPPHSADPNLWLFYHWHLGRVVVISMYALLFWEQAVGIFVMLEAHWEIMCPEHSLRRGSAQGFLFSHELAEDGSRPVTKRWGRIKFLILPGIKPGSCTSTRGKRMCFCNTSPMIASILKPEVIKLVLSLLLMVQPELKTGKSSRGWEICCPCRVPRDLYLLLPPLYLLQHSDAEGAALGGHQERMREEKLAVAEVWSLRMRHCSSWAQPFSSNQKYPSPLKHSLGTCLHHLEKLL